MANPMGNREEGRALAFGALLRKLRRERGWTLARLAKKIPMSSSNLSRLELGTQSPPADEVIETIAGHLGINAAELLRAAGRPMSGLSFEEEVLDHLLTIRRDVEELRSAVGRRPDVEH
jgi:transcriptional regulator with XRE-family HTH domain